MKANEAPEKIYLIRNFTTSTSLNTTNDYRGKYLPEWYKSREKDADIEYIRKDAFIEKACEWLKNFNDFHNIIRYSDCCEVPLEQIIENFEEYLKK